MLKTDLLYSRSVLGGLWLSLRNSASERVYVLAFAPEVITVGNGSCVALLSASSQLTV